MPSDSTVGDGKTPGETPIPRGPWSVEDHAGAPRATRPRRVAWFLGTSLPAWMLLAVGVLGATLGGSWVTALAYGFAGATVAITVWNSRNLYRRGYYIGSLQQILDRSAGRTLDDTYHRPEPHPADPSPVPDALRDEDDL